MKRILAARDRQEILRDREEHEQRKNEQQRRFDEQYNQYTSAERAVADSVKAQVESKLAKFSALNLEINVERTFQDNVRIVVKSNDHNVHDVHKALSWTWSAELNRQTGEVSKESGSWSGLNATTPEQLTSLKQSVEALEILNDIDWSSMLNVQFPEYSKYITEKNPRWSRDAEPDFERELAEADVESVIGTHQLIKSVRDGGRSYRGVVYFGVVKETPSMYTVFEVPGLYIDYLHKGQVERLPEGRRTFADIADPDHYMTYNMKKDTFFKSVEIPVVIVSE